MRIVLGISFCQSGSPSRAKPPRGSPIITGMDLEALVQNNIDAEISRLEKARALLTGHTAPLKRGKRKPMSAEGRARIAAAQKKRWAKAKKKG